MQNKPIKIPSNIQVIFDLLEHHGYECFLVGGAVRNALLNIPIHDFDLTTNATPNEMLEIFQQYHTLTNGIKHGTVTVIVDHEPIEVTTYRVESEYKDHRHPECVYFTRTLKDDLSRRDFTINAMAYHPSFGIIDEFGGQMDLNNKILRTVNNPFLRFDEDALRILRGIRFQARLHLTLDYNTKRAMLEKAHLVQCISKERITSELTGILQAPFAKDALLQQYDVLSIIFKDLVFDDFAKNCNYIEAAQQLDLDSLDLCYAFFASNTKDPYAFLKKEFKLSKQMYKSLHYILTKQPLPKTRIEMRFLIANYQEFALKMVLFQAIQNNIDRNTPLTLYKEVLQNDCTSIKQLNITAQDVISLGYCGKDIQTALSTCLHRVMQDEVKNTKEDLYQLLKEGTNS